MVWKMIRKMISRFNIVSGLIVISILLGWFVFKEERRQIILERKVGRETLEDIAGLLTVYSVYDANGPIKLVRNGRDGDGGYIVPEEALKQADALIGYGVADDISFEEEFSNKYGKESYGFDCSVKSIDIKNKLTHFIPECIGTDKFLYGNARSSNITSFAQQLQNLNLVGKKLFIKMDIEGAEFEALPEILKDAKDITGVTMEIHFYQRRDRVSNALKLLSLLEQDFFLVHAHGNNCCNTFTTKNSKGSVPRVLELSYINKSLVLKAEVAKDQTHPTELDVPNVKSKEDRKFEIIVPGHESTNEISAN